VNKERLKVACAGFYFFNFAAKEHGVFEKSLISLNQLASDLDFDLIVYEKLIDSKEEAEAANAFFIENNIDFLLLQASSFFKGEVVLPLAANDFKIGYWLMPEPVAGGELQLNSLTGFNLGVSFIRKNFPKRKFKWYYGNGDEAEFQESFSITVKALSCLKNLGQSRVALIDEVVPGFDNLDFDAYALKSNLGLEVVNVTLEDFFNKMTQSGEERPLKIKNIMDEITSDSVEVNVPDEELEKTARVAESMQLLGVERNFQAAALKCWPEFQGEKHMAPCAALSYLNDNNLITSCEGDLPGAVSMLAAAFLSDDAPTISDPVAIDIERNMVQMWHCGPGPASWADEEGRKLSWHHTLNRRIGADEKPYGVSSDLSFMEGPVTILRISGDGTRMFVLEGDVFKSSSGTYCGSAGWVGKLTSDGEGYSAQDFVQTIADYGLEHHYPLMKGHWEKVLRELAAWSGMEILKISRYKSYLK
jgi:L-fucose isomerase-like protein